SESTISEAKEMWAARELSDETTPPEISLRRFGWLFMKTWPFMEPMKWHILLTAVIVPIVMIAVGNFSGTITGDLWANKILGNAEKLQPVQAAFLFVDDSFVKHDILVERAYEDLTPRPALQTFSMDIVGYSVVGGQDREKILHHIEKTLSEYYTQTFALDIVGPQLVPEEQRQAILSAIEDGLSSCLRSTETQGIQTIDWGLSEEPFRWWGLASPRERMSFATTTIQTTSETDLAGLKVKVDRIVEAMEISGVAVDVFEQSINVKEMRVPQQVVPVPGEREIYAEGMLEVSGHMDLAHLKTLMKPITDPVYSQANIHEMSQDQRRTVRNRSLMWFAFGALFSIVAWTGITPYYTAWVWQNVIHHLRVRMIEQVEHVSLQFHNDSRAGDAIFRVNQDSNQINVALQQAIMEPSLTAYNVAIVSSFVVGFDPLLAGGVLVVALAMLGLTIAFTPNIRRRSVANRVTNSNLTSRLQETFAAMKLVKANRAENLVLDRFNADSHKALDASLYYRFVMIVLSMLVMLLGGGLIIGLEYLMVTWTVADPAKATYLGWLFVSIIGFKIWNLGAFGDANGRINGLLWEGYGLVRWWGMMQDLFIGLERAFYFIDLKPDVVDSDEPKDYPTSIQRVTWSGVRFGYKDDQPVLQGVDLQADVGTVTAIVGQTGSGKSTLMSLLLRLFDPTEGKVEINGIDLKDFRVDDIRTNSAIALQKNILFTGKVADNISYAVNNATREDVEQAAKIACAHDFIVAMDGGYDSELGDRGSKLSAGQRQRLTIARAVIRNTPILILDEPTASLDAQTEQEVLANLAQWGRDRIVFLITHRLSTIRNADQIAFLEDGRIVETGSHEELMARSEGRYRGFVQAETVGVEGGDA
ncbi:MAG: ABC transporter ATP-binding protein, partial [Desulfobacterales bacterium]